jgi:hypothetical protein
MMHLATFARPLFALAEIAIAFSVVVVLATIAALYVFGKAMIRGIRGTRELRAA